MEDKYLDTSVTLSLTAPKVPRFDCAVFLKKEESDEENTLNVGFNVHENDTFNMVSVRAKHNCVLILIRPSIASHRYGLAH